MSIASEITRLAGLRDTIRSKLLDFGIITDSSAKLSACSEAIDNIQESSLSIPSIAITPGMSMDSSTGIVTASGSGSGIVTASEGYLKETSGTVNASASNTLQLATQAAQTITPGTSNKTIAAGRWLTGAQTIKGDSNLVAANIASGKSIFGASGSFEPSLKTFYSSDGTISWTYPDSDTAQIIWFPFTIPLHGITPYFLSARFPSFAAVVYSVAPPVNNVLTVYCRCDTLVNGGSDRVVHGYTQQCAIKNSQITVNLWNYTTITSGDNSSIMYLYIVGI